MAPTRTFYLVSIIVSTALCVSTLMVLYTSFVSVSIDAYERCEVRRSVLGKEVRRFESSTCRSTLYGTGLDHGKQRSDGNGVKE